MNSLWSTNLKRSSAKKFEKEYASSLRKFNFIKSSTNTINIYDILTVLKINYNDTEWGIPKGRRNLNECDLDVAKENLRKKLILILHNILFLALFHL